MLLFILGEDAFNLRPIDIISNISSINWIFVFAIISPVGGKLESSLVRRSVVSGKWTFGPFDGVGIRNRIISPGSVSHNSKMTCKFEFWGHLSTFWLRVILFPADSTYLH